ncbi:MAG: complex I NDUFA9 subunit family protein [Kiloniellales bacterium]|nr:complex I NDUFA9 subunit family protein [Kiloniellales bacterium]
MDDSIEQKRATVFGGTGFLGRAVVKRLDAEGAQVRVAARRPPVGTLPAGVEAVEADLRDAASVARAAADRDWVVNAVALYRERRGETFQAVHVEGARRVAEAAASGGAEALVHISGIGADPASESGYVRARAAGEAAVREAFPEATILRPSVLFGPEDSFTNSLAKIAKLAPIFPLFGDGSTRLQPVFVEDAAAAVVRALARTEARGRIYELGGKTYSYRELIEFLMRQIGIRRPLLPLPFALWEALARLLSPVPRAPITRDQIALMRQDNVADPKLPGFAELGLEPATVEDVLPRYLGAGGS